MLKPSIYVISLQAAQDRKASMRQQLDALGVAYEFFDAVHGTQNPDHHLFKKYNDSKRALRRGANASLRLSQLGCFASHYLLWEKCVQKRTPFIVLEDDAVLQAPFMSFYEHASEFAANYGLVWLQPSRKVAKQSGRFLEKIGPFKVKKFFKGFSGTTGYLITPATAQTLLDYSTEWIYPVDNTMDRFYEHKVEAIGLDPVCLAQDDGFESFINDAATHGHKRSLSDTIRREYTNFKDTFSRNTHNLAFYIKTMLR
ncbi:glycosyltransferase family 25 protein [Alcaligenaceae bacterium]|nr:glycosyltransferase family 25 protein [Alcaligenaceae bacterium]